MSYGRPDRQTLLPIAAALDGLRQKDVAQAMGVSQARISQIESGAISEVATLAAYVTALGAQLKIVADFGDSSMVIDMPGGRRTG